MKKLILGFTALLAIVAFSTTTVTAADEAPAKCGSATPKPVAPDVMCGRSK